MTKIYDVAIIGAGASGLCAAIAAARRQKSVALLEKNARVGKKILATGNGRCNLSNENIKPESYHCKAQFVFDIMDNFDAREFFASLGLMCKADSQGRIYPYSNTAASVLDALRLAAQNYGAQEICNFNASDIECKNGIFCIKSENESVYAKSVVISSGGYQSDNSSYRIAKKLGHKITALSPSLCPIPCDDPVLKSLKGMRINAVATLMNNGTAVKSEAGEIQFADNDLSGICIFNLSHMVSACKNPSVRLDLCPDFSHSQLRELLFKIKKDRKKNLCEDFLSGLFPKRIGQALIKDIIQCKQICDINSEQIEKLCKKAKSWEFKVRKNESFKNAQVTNGGVDFLQVKNTLESKLVKGIFFCGEVLDIDADCGGFNLNWAWASGVFAGTNATIFGEKR